MDKMSVLTAKTRQYKVISRDTVSVGIWDNCYTGIAVRGDGLRARIKIPYVRWHNNSGSLGVQVVYIDGRDAVKKTIKLLRKCQISEIKNEYAFINFGNKFDFLATHCN